MVAIDMVATGKNIKMMRNKAGKTVRDIQNACGISGTAVINWQSGKAMPTMDNMVILAHIFGVKMDDIVVVRQA